MKNMSKGLIAIIIVLCALVMALGSLLIATAESGVGELVVRDTQTSTSIPSPTILISITPSIIGTLQPEIESTITESQVLFPTATAKGQSCNIPNGWVPIFTDKNDTLDSLANEYGTTVKKLKNSNCLDSNKIHKNDIIFVPKRKSTSTPTATYYPTSPPIVCYTPTGWIKYTVRSGDTLYSIARLYSTTTAKLQSANCIINPNYLQTGDVLLVPDNPTITPTNTPKTPTSTPKP